MLPELDAAASLFFSSWSSPTMSWTPVFIAVDPKALPSHSHVAPLQPNISPSGLRHPPRVASRWPRFADGAIFILSCSSPGSNWRQAPSVTSLLRKATVHVAALRLRTNLSIVPDQMLHQRAAQFVTLLKIIHHFRCCGATQRLMPPRCMFLSCWG